MESKKRAIIYILTAAVLAGVGQLFWKISTIDAQNYLEIFLSPWLYIGTLFYVIATLAMVIALKNGELSILYPILATTYIWTTLSSVYIFPDEDLKLLRVMGIILISLGACALGIQQQKNAKKT